MENFRWYVLVARGVGRVFPICFLLTLLGISLGCTNSGDGANRSGSESRDRQSVAPTPESAHVAIDIPKLAFARKIVVEKMLGKPLRDQRGTNMMTWSQGSIVVTSYRHAQCTYLEGRLVSITYEFKKRPTTVADALELSGLPRESASLDNAHQDHLPYRTTSVTGWTKSVQHGFAREGILFLRALTSAASLAIARDNCPLPALHGSRRG